MKGSLILERSKVKELKFMRMVMLIMENSSKMRKKVKEFFKRSQEILMKANSKRDA